MARQSRRVPVLFASTLVLSLALGACDRQEPLGMEGGDFRLASAYAPSSGIIECSGTPGTTVKVTVKGWDKKAAMDAVVVAVNPEVEGGQRCIGRTNGSGVVEFRNLPATGKRFFTIRTEVPEDAARLEIVPTVPTSALDLVWNPAGIRNAPLLVGGAKCSNALPFSWDNMVAVTNAPCDLSQTKSVAVTLPKASGLVYPEFKNLNGVPVPGIIVAALSGAAFQSGTFDATKVDYYCDLLPFLNQQECQDGTSHGAAFVYAMTETDHTGRPPTGLAVGPGRILIEAVGELDGAALFGTFEDFTDGQSMVLEPGICRVDYAQDNVEPAGTAAVDLKEAYYGIGLTLEEVISQGLVSASLAAVPTTLLVKLQVERNGPGGTGELTFQLRSSSMSGQNTVRAAFEVSAARCAVTSWSGTGLTPGVAYQGFCSYDAMTSRYTLVFQLYGLPTLTSATWSAKTSGTGGYGNDNFDTSRADLTAAGLPFDVNNHSCDLQLNTDGRLVPTS